MATAAQRRSTADGCPWRRNAVYAEQQLMDLRVQAKGVMAGMCQPSSPLLLPLPYAGAQLHSVAPAELAVKKLFLTPLG
ncbi:hypothetical protein BK025_12135 [Sodalis sp. TME1]|nr:hypothetical protein BK025_12135 [Sodalis sp. TME1]